MEKEELKSQYKEKDLVQTHLRVFKSNHMEAEKCSHLSMHRMSPEEGTPTKAGGNEGAAQTVAHTHFNVVWTNEVVKGGYAMRMMKQEEQKVHLECVQKSKRK